MGFGEDDIFAIPSLKSAEVATFPRLVLPSHDVEPIERDSCCQQAFETGVDVVVHADCDEDPDLGDFIGRFVDLGLYPVTWRDVNAVEHHGVQGGVAGSDCDKFLLLGQKGERPKAERFVLVEELGDAIVEARSQEPGLVQRPDSGWASGDVWAAVAKPKIVEGALEPVHKPMASDPLPFGPHSCTIGEISNQYVNCVGKDHLEAISDEWRSNGRSVVGHGYWS